MSTKHKMLTTIPHGPSDEGAEIDVEITFNFTKGSGDYWNKSGGHWEQGYAPEIEFASACRFCNGKPSPFYGAFADLAQQWLNDLAEAWLESNQGEQEAIDVVASDDEAAREYATELRREP